MTFTGGLILLFLALAALDWIVEARAKKRDRYYGL